MPLYDGMEETVRAHLERLAKGEKVPMMIIGCFTDVQFEAINQSRTALDLHVLERNEIFYRQAFAYQPIQRRLLHRRYCTADRKRAL